MWVSYARGEGGMKGLIILLSKKKEKKKKKRKERERATS